MDADRDHALADGRAKDEWTKSAIRAQYGAYGPGKLPPGAGSGETGLSHSGATASGSSSDSATAASSSANRRSSSSGPAPIPPRQSYANELLTQCRKCREELDRERQKERNEATGDSWFSLSSYWGGGAAEKEDKGKAVAGKQETQSKSVVQSVVKTLSPSASSSSSSSSADSSEASSTSIVSSALSSVTSLLPFSSGGDPSPNVPVTPPVDHEGEAGWTGSGVWGLSAVGTKQREKDRERDVAVRSGRPVEDDGGARQRQIEWEGFMRYAERKERELYDIFNELDRNGDMKLDKTEIRNALDKAGVDASPMSLEDFVASLTSSRTAAPYASRNPREKPYVTFPEFRDYLLLLPRKPSVSEVSCQSGAAGGDQQVTDRDAARVDLPLLPSPENVWTVPRRRHLRRARFELGKARTRRCCSYA